MIVELTVALPICHDIKSGVSIGASLRARVVLLIDRDWEVYIRAHWSACCILICTRREDRLRALAVLCDQAPHVTQPMAREVQPERTLVEEDIDVPRCRTRLRGRQRLENPSR